jgi:hypothetical protein
MILSDLYNLPLVELNRDRPGKHTVAREETPRVVQEVKDESIQDRPTTTLAPLLLTLLVAAHHRTLQ